jgi:hypothetical protein
LSDVEQALSGAEAQLEAATDPSTVFGRVLAALGDSTIGNVSATDLACLIIDKCSSLFHPNPDEADDKLDYLDVFEVSIGKYVRLKLSKCKYYLLNRDQASK